MPKGVTLIETLVVLVLLGMLAGVGAVTLAGTSTQASIMDAYTSALDLDGKARTAAVRGQSVQLRLEDGHIELVESDSEEVLASRSVGPDVDLRWFDGSGLEPLYTLHFDSRGHTRDSQLVIGIEGDPATPKRWAISGLTGWPESMP